MNRIIQKLKTLRPGSKAWVIIPDPLRKIQEPIRFITRQMIVDKIVIEKNCLTPDIYVLFDCGCMSFHMNYIFKTKKAACKKADLLTFINRR